MTRLTSVLLVFLLLCAPVAQAAELGGLCAGSRLLTVGQWAKYQSDVPFLTTMQESRLAIVGTEAVDGKDH